MGPRLFGIPATEAPIVAIIRRGPSGWCNLGRWDTGRDEFRPGSWIRARRAAGRGQPVVRTVDARTSSAWA